MLQNLKLQLRISSSAFDDEITDLMLAAEMDLKLAGVIDSKFEKTNDIYDDALIKRAVTVYVKAYFGWNNPDYDKFKQSYESIKLHITLSDEYITEVVV